MGYVERGMSHSISGKFEDLMAAYLASKDGAEVSDRLEAHIVFMILENGSETATSEIESANKELELVNMYCLSTNGHPNQYPLKNNKAPKPPVANKKDFRRLLSNLCP